MWINIRSIQLSYGKTLKTEKIVLANGIVIAKACANWTETLPSSKSRDTKTRTDIKNLLRTKVRYCSVVSESVVICQITLKMAEEIDFENWKISNFKGLVTLTLTLDRVIRHTVVHHSSTSTYIPNFIGIGKTFCGRTDVWTYGHLRPILLGRHFGVRYLHSITHDWLNEWQPFITDSHWYCITDPDLPKSSMSTKYTKHSCKTITLYREI